MAVAAPDRPRRKTKGQGQAPRPWWGDGPAPLEQWPGVTIEIPAAWNRARDRWESPDGRYYFDVGEADRAEEFFPDLLTHHIGEFAGQPFTLMAYQVKLLTRPVFGWRRASDGQRRFRKVFAFIPKGGGKSPWAAGTGLYLARCDGEAAAEVYVIANDRQQGRTVHDNAKILVEGSDTLREGDGVGDGAEITKDSIYWPRSHSTFQVLSSEASSAHGKRPYCLIVDEPHGFVGERDRELYEALKKSLIKRRQPLLILISHAGTNDESLCFEEYEYAKGVLDGKIPDDTCLPVIFEARPDEDWTSEETLQRVHPGYGVTVQIDALQTELLEAKSEPRKQNDYKRYYLNLWTNQAVAWIPNEWWDRCNEPIPSDEHLRTLPVGAGLDLAQKIDLASLVLAFRERIATKQEIAVTETDEETGAQVTKIIDLNYRVILLPFFWIPDETMRDHERDEGLPYALWAREHLITPTDGPVIDYTRIYRDITTKILPRFPRLKQGGVGYDPAFATDLAQNLRDRGGVKVEEVLQNYRYMNEPCQITEALIKGRRVVHGGHRVLRHHMENVAIKTDDAGRIRPVRPKKTGKHIDGVVASLMGLRMVAAQPDRRKSIGVMVV